MITKKIGIILNGVTGRMGANQHYGRSILPLVQQGGLKLNDRETLLPVPILVGRNEPKLERLAALGPNVRWTTRLEDALADPENAIYFDAQTTGRRVEAVQQAIAAGKHIYCEKPTATHTAAAIELYRLARAAGVKHGRRPGQALAARPASSSKPSSTPDSSAASSPSAASSATGSSKAMSSPHSALWNYRKEDGGGIIVDMLCHWRYVLDNLFGKVKAVSCLGATHIPQRWDEAGKPYPCTADDAAYATFELEGGIIAQFNSSWCVRVRRDDLLTLQVDGTHGTAVAGLRDCHVQHASATPKPVWNPDIPNPIDFLNNWTRVPDYQPFENAFKAQWERFLRHVALDEPFPWNLLEGAKGVQLAEKGLQSWTQRAWVSIPEL
jgi:predicted dehydrogenase